MQFYSSHTDERSMKNQLGNFNLKLICRVIYNNLLWV